MTNINPIETLEKQKYLIASLKGHRKKDINGFDLWNRNTHVAIKKIFGEGSDHEKEFSELRYSLGFFSSSTPDSKFDDAYNRGLDRAFSMLESMIHEIKTYGLESESSHAKRDPVLNVINLLQKFHTVAKQIRKRHSDRETIEINDEYDVQDLLHGLLKIDFDDIRPEEYTPSYAGASTRVDFLLKREKIIIEVKKTRRGLNAKEIGEQLLIDIARYKSHPDCETLICFVYDPEERVANPIGLESDLEKNTSEINVKVIISPK